MSIYSDCARAAGKLAKKAEPFTEIDVVILAGRGKHWSKAIHKDAMKQANLAVLQMYRASKLVRFGPVEFNGELDYGRLASKIVYAGVVIEDEKKIPLVPEWETPNGTFPALFVGADTIGRPGRRSGNNRDDMQLWSKQTVESTGADENKVARRKGSGPEVANNPVKILNDRLREQEALVALLRTELDAARSALADQEIVTDSRVRQIAGEIALDLIADLEIAVNTRFEGLNERVERLEKVDEANRRVYLQAAV